jgi:hypothetical protein
MARQVSQQVQLAGAGGPYLADNSIIFVNMYSLLLLSRKTKVTENNWLKNEMAIFYLKLYTMAHLEYIV